MKELAQPVERLSRSSKAIGMERVIRFIAAVMLGLCVLAVAAYTLFTAVMSIVWLNPLGMIVAAIGVVVTIALVKLTKRIAHTLTT